MAIYKTVSIEKWKISFILQLKLKFICTFSIYHMWIIYHNIKWTFVFQIFLIHSPFRLIVILKDEMKKKILLSQIPLYVRVRGTTVINYIFCCIFEWYIYRIPPYNRFQKHSLPYLLLKEIQFYIVISTYNVSYHIKIHIFWCKTLHIYNEMTKK